MTININQLRKKPLEELYELCNQTQQPLQGRPSRSDLSFHLAKHFHEQGNELEIVGVLQQMEDGYGFLRSLESFKPGLDDIYVAQKLISKYQLRSGDTVKGKLRLPRERERYLALTSVDEINFLPPEKNKTLLPYNDLKAYFPVEWLKLEQGSGAREDLTGRIIDMVAPVGKGQRSLIVSPPKAGKTMMLQQIAKSILRNNPESHVFVLLIDERPEEVTDFERNVDAEVISSTFDEAPSSHVQKAELVLARAKRLANAGHDVVILMDSLTRLARAYNTLTPASGKILTGGLDANALQRPRRFFSAARNIEGAGSLTIIATALVDTGSKMDDIIYEEFKGTGNHEIHLSRQMSNKLIYPSIQLSQSGTRREEKLVPEEYLNNAHILRKYMATMEDMGALEFLIDRMKSSKTNLEFFQNMRKR